MSTTRSSGCIAATIIGAALSIGFFLFFAFATGSISFSVLRTVGPGLRFLRENFGQPYAHALGYLLAFLIGSASSFAFVYPATFFVRDVPKLMLVAALVSLPAVCVLSIDSTLSLSDASVVIQPIVGALIAIAMRPNNSFKPKPLRGSA